MQFRWSVGPTFKTNSTIDKPVKPWHDAANPGSNFSLFQSLHLPLSHSNFTFSYINLQRFVSKPLQSFAPLIDLYISSLRAFLAFFSKESTLAS